MGLSLSFNHYSEWVVRSAIRRMDTLLIHKGSKTWKEHKTNVCYGTPKYLGQSLSQYSYRRLFDEKGFFSADLLSLGETKRYFCLSVWWIETLPWDFSWQYSAKAVMINTKILDRTKQKDFLSEHKAVCTWNSITCKHFGEIITIILILASNLLTIEQLNYITIGSWWCHTKLLYKVGEKTQLWMRQLRKSKSTHLPSTPSHSLILPSQHSPPQVHSPIPTITSRSKPSHSNTPLPKYTLPFQHLPKYTLPSQPCTPFVS